MLGFNSLDEMELYQMTCEEFVLPNTIASKLECLEIVKQYGLEKELKTIT